MVLGRTTCIPPSSPLQSMPLELQLQICRYLPYPDALSLKHSSRHFYALVDTGVRLKVSWLLERKELDLDIPRRKCILKTDEAFCSSREIRDFMERRRWHLECRGGVCAVVEGANCERRTIWRRGRVQRLRWALRRGVTGLRMRKPYAAVMFCWLFGLALAVFAWWMRT